MFSKVCGLVDPDQIERWHENALNKQTNKPFCEFLHSAAKGENKTPPPRMPSEEEALHPLMAQTRRETNAPGY